MVSLTAKYLDNQFKAAFPFMQELETELQDKRLVSPVKPFIMNYTSVASFSGNNRPTPKELEAALAQAFTQSGKTAYLELLQNQLAESNLFGMSYPVRAG